MSRIVIIGNGFDLAHGLKTSYWDFMEFIKTETNPTRDSIPRRSPNSKECTLIHHKFKNKENPFIGFKYDTKINEFRFSTCKNNPSIYFKQLFKEFNTHRKWADLEALYFKEVSKNIDSVINIRLINKEFAYLKELLEYYLQTQIEHRIGKNYDFDRDNRFNTKFPDREKLIGIINFNYTSKLISNYISSLEFKQYSSELLIINIHGKLQDKKNPIIFGYGDDNSEEYKKLQNTENNELLINFKTFQYLRTEHYKTILRLLKTRSDIKVEIIGHSCGLSDKTLLKTIFEHPNAKTIEYRYHSTEENYFENIYNISRIFTDNELMRSRVVDLANTRKITQREIELIELDETND